ncbi:MAG: hypothetical protein MUP41_07875 [Desulfobacterales bacterium]|nr:hypothetical protein [Desulfobacterales bacterium]
MKKFVWCLVIVLIISLLIPSATFAQKKSPTTAVVLSALLPGAGQFYTQQSNKGLLMTGTYLGAMGLVIGYGPWTWEKKESSPYAEGLSYEGTSSTTKAIWYGSVAVAGGVWIWSMIDAGSSAKKINQGLSFEPMLKEGQAGLMMTMRFDL